MLLGHPDIQDAAVIGVVVDDEKTELPRAYVVRRRSDLTVEEVYEYSAKQLLRYKRLDGGIVFVDSIPKTLAGKILKRLLRAKL